MNCWLSLKMKVCLNISVLDMSCLFFSDCMPMDFNKTMNHLVCFIVV